MKCIELINLLLLSWSLFVSSVLSFDFTREIAEITIQSYELKVLVSEDPGSNLINIPPQDIIDAYKFDRYKLFRREGDNHNDQTLLVKKNGKCYVAWPGTSDDVLDWLDNFNSDPIEIKNNCTVHEGYYNELELKGLFRNNITEEILDCLKSCGEEDEDENDNVEMDSDNKDCPLVLTGFSQGGAVAVIASIMLEELSQQQQYVVTFGAPPAIYSVETCMDYIQQDSHFRFVNTNRGNFPTRLCADSVPDRSSNRNDNNKNRRDLLQHVGHAFSLGNNLQEAGIIPSIKYHGNISGAVLVPSSVCTSAHLQYGPKIDLLENYTNNNDNVDDYYFPLNIDGYSINDLCSNDIECASGRCTPSEKEDADYNTCQAKLETCKSGCNSAKDCLSGVCIRGICAYNDETRCVGSPCSINSQCLQGGMCQRNWDGKRVCMIKGGPCDDCNQDSDCNSNACYYGKCGPVGDANVTIEVCSTSGGTRNGGYRQQNVLSFFVTLFYLFVYPLCFF